VWKYFVLIHVVPTAVEKLFFVGWVEWDGMEWDWMLTTMRDASNGT